MTEEQAAQIIEALPEEMTITEALDEVLEYIHQVADANRSHRGGNTMTQREQYKQAEHGNTIPTAITEISIKRNPYNDSVYVVMQASLWSARFSTPEDNMYTRINEIAAEMERTQ